MFRSIARPLIAVSALALLAACQKKEEPPQQPDANPAATVPTAANEATAADFAPKAAASDMYEIQAAQVAIKRSKNADVKAFAQMMVDAHTKSSTDLNAAATAASLKTKPRMQPSSAQRDKLRDLNRAPSAGFDKAYLNQQVDAHVAAVDLVRKESTEADSPMRSFAVTLLPVVSGHLDKAKALAATK